MIRKKQKGSITVFGVLVSVLVAECILVLLEGARLEVINQSAAWQSELAMESVFANYCSALWEEYHLLGCDASETEATLMQSANARNSEDEWRNNLLEYSPKELDLISYTLITDGNGLAYQNAVADYMKDNILYESAKMIYGVYEAISDITDSDTSDLSDIDKALESLEEYEEENSSTSYETAAVNRRDDGDSGGTAGKEKETAATGDISLLESIQELQKKGILEIVAENPEELSQASFDTSQTVSNRALSEGKDSRIRESEWLDRILLQQYVLSYLSSYGKEMENRALSYEIEYLIGGCESDVENLRMVAERLLLIRMSVNMLYLLSDAVKVEEANALAVVIAGVSLNPVVVQLVAAALLTAWSFGESILDIRGLMQGKRIPLLKSSDTWTLQLSQIGELADGSLTAKESKVGFSYGDYLGILILLTDDSTIAMRAMDVQEATVRKCSGNADFKMDRLMIQAEAIMTYEYKPVFRIFESLSTGMDWNREITKTVNYQYGS